MFAVLRNRTYRHLFTAQVLALLGTGLATVALGLLAFDLAGKDAGIVLGTVLAIKMLAYVGVAPVAAAFAERLPRRATLVALDVVRAAVALLLPFVTQIWMIYILIFLLQAASAAFTPTFQATIPDVLPEERDYTNALSLSRLAYDTESLLSPVLAAALLGVVSFHVLFAGTSLGFVASALLVLSVALPKAPATPKRSIYERTTRGARIFLATPRLRGLLAINAGAAAAGSMVLVNTVVIVQGQWGLAQSAVAMASAAFGAGSMIAALSLPRLLDRWSDRPVMLSGVAVLALSMLVGGWVDGYPKLLALWLVAGIGYSTALTPSGRLLRRSSQPADRPALFAAQFALSHLCWLLFYPLAGWIGSRYGIPAAFAVLGVAAALTIVIAVFVWPRREPKALEHEHLDLQADHEHLKASAPGQTQHSHEFQIDDLHQRWPQSGSAQKTGRE